jgi:signal recognition particle subunit SRP19
MRKKNKFFLWSIYFDSSKTRNEGRRVPKNQAISSPKLVELQRAAKKLGLQSEVIFDAAHPRSPLRKTGLIIIPKTESKSITLKKIAKELSNLR